jgi:hypothetical protein
MDAWTFLVIMHSHAAVISKTRDRGGEITVRVFAQVLITPR